MQAHGAQTPAVQVAREAPQAVVGAGESIDVADAADSVAQRTLVLPGVQIQAPQRPVAVLQLMPLGQVLVAE